MKRATVWARGAMADTLKGVLDLAGVAPCPDLSGDALIWHEEAPDALPPLPEQELIGRVRAGMGLVLLEGAAFTGFAQRLLGLQKIAVPPSRGQRVWLANREHPAFAGLPPFIDAPGNPSPFAPEPSRPCDGLICLSMLDGQTLLRSGFWYDLGGRAVVLHLGGESYPLAAVARLTARTLCWAMDKTNEKDGTNP